MAGKKAAAGRILEVLSSGRRALAGRDERVVVRVHVDPDCPRDAALALKGALVPERASGVVEVMGPGLPAAPREDPDAVLVLVGPSPCEGLVGAYARSGVPVGMVVEGKLDAPRVELPEQAAALVGTIASSDPAAVPDRVAAWLARAVDKPLALAACFPFCRGAVADALVARCAAENAVVGAISLIPGSDFPVMCANQAKLALDLAAAYGRDVEPARLAELGGVIAGGLLWRSVARGLAGLLPGAGALLKAGIGYGGTLATGRALRLRLEVAGRVGDGPSSPASPGDAGATGALPGARPADEGYVTIGGAGA